MAGGSGDGTGTGTGTSKGKGKKKDVPGFKAGEEVSARYKDMKWSVPVRRRPQPQPSLLDR